MKCPNFGCAGSLTYEEHLSLPVDMETGEVCLEDGTFDEVVIFCDECGDVTSQFTLAQDGPIIWLTYSPPRALST